MSNPIIRIHISTTDEVIDREMTDAEFAAYQGEQAKDKVKAETEAQAATDKAALLAKLGITADEAKLLLS
jgi:hypothetical protein